MTWPRPGRPILTASASTSPPPCLFDSLTNRGDINWTLTGAAGNLVSSQTFNNADSSTIGGSDATTLATGSYTLTVAGNNSAIGTYGFRLLDVASATQADLTTVQSGTLDDAGYAAQAAHTTPGAPLTNPSANVALTLGEAGVNATVPNQAALQPGTLTVEAWVNPDFNAGTPAVIVQQGAGGAGYGLQIGNDGNLQFQIDGTVLEAPNVLQQGVWTQVAGTFDGATMHLIVNGQDVADQAFAGPIIYDGNGLTIGAADSNGDSLFQGAIDELRVWNVARTPDQIAAASTQELGPQAGLVADYHFDETSGLTLIDSSGNGFDATIGNLPGTSTALLNFNLVAGQTYYLNVLGSTGDITTRLFNPTGAMVLGPEGLQDQGGITAEVSGTYTLALEGRITNGQEATYQIQLVPSTTATATLDPDTIVSGSVDQPSQGTAYSFTLGAETDLVFDTLSSDQNLQWALTGPTTTLTGEQLQNSTGTYLDLAAGDYTLTITGQGNTTGAYSFQLLDVAAATPFNLGDDVTATVAQPGDAVLYGFAANAGDTVSFNEENASDYGSWRLFDPYGRLVFGPNNFNSQTGLVLPADGTYVLSVEGSANYGTQPTVEFATSLDAQNPPAALEGTPIAIGAPVSGTLDGNGDEQDFTFTAGPDASVYFEALSDNGTSWTLTGPRGVEISNKGFVDTSGNIALELPVAGTYQLAINGQANAGFGFQLVDLTQPTAALPTDGSTTLGSMDAQYGVSVYSFDGTAGTNVFLDGSNGNGLNFALIDPYGTLVQGPQGLATPRWRSIRPGNIR